MLLMLRWLRQISGWFIHKFIHIHIATIDVLVNSEGGCSLCGLSQVW